jgi:hypothetical protein
MGERGMMGPPGGGMMGPSPVGGGMPIGEGGGMPEPTTAGADSTGKGVYVIILEGYTPNKGNLAYLLPPDVGLDRAKWGFFNRLRYLGKPDATVIVEKGKEKTLPVSSAMQPGMDGASAMGGGMGGMGGMGPRPGMGGGPGRPSGPGRPVPGGPAVAEETQPAVPAAVSAAGGDTEIKLVAPTSQYQTSENEAAAKLPFETFIDFQKPLERSFDTTESDWITMGQSQRFPQPMGLGILKPVSATSMMVGMGGGAPGRMGMPGEMGIMGGGIGGMGLGGGMGMQGGELIDPFTFETISTTYALDSNGNPKLDSSNRPELVKHDYWFRVKLKVKMKSPAGEPAPAATTASAGPRPSGPGQPR